MSTVLRYTIADLGLVTMWTCTISKCYILSYMTRQCTTLEIYLLFTVARRDVSHVVCRFHVGVAPISAPYKEFKVAHACLISLIVIY